MDKKDKQHLQEEFPFKWQVKLKYLEVKFAASWKDLYQMNYIPLLNEIKEEIRKISTRPLSWVGRIIINIIKMGILPKVL